ncbi:MAG TPA: glycosyltransferase family 4 protein [Isosphaeraceae bacterium]|jgi:glycosyltransferase involved in cell wall biosynthesis|nr:glycosyltransferase family 4 protein [Isosphaeraceae bacterium]
MTVAAWKVMLLAGPWSTADDAARVRGLVRRLASQGVEAEVVGVGPVAIDGMIACPGLARPWLRTLSARWLTADGARAPELLHVLRADLDAAGLALAERWGVPYLVTVDEFLPTGGRLRLGRRLCRGIVATGTDLADDLGRTLGVPRDSLTVIPPGIEPAEPATPEAGSGGARVPVVGASGPLRDGSGLGTFLRAARIALDTGRDAEFVVAGRGREEAELRRLAGQLGVADRVTFTGEADAAGPFWKVLDLFCQTATGPTSGRPLAMALARGIPAIATDVPGLRPPALDAEPGLRVRPGDADALAEAILALLDDPDRARRLGMLARDWAAHLFDPDREAADLAALYRRVLDAAAVGRLAVVCADAASRRS